MRGGHVYANNAKWQVGTEMPSWAGGLVETVWPPLQLEVVGGMFTTRKVEEGTEGAGSNTPLPHGVVLLLALRTCNKRLNASWEHSSSAATRLDQMSCLDPSSVFFWLLQGSAAWHPSARPQHRLVTGGWWCHGHL